MAFMRIALAGAALALAACQNTGQESGPGDMVLAEGANNAFFHTHRTQAPADQIWALWTDVSTWKSWDQGLADAELDGPMGLGATGRIIPHAGPSSRFEVTAFEDGQSYTFETQLPLARLVVTRSFISREPVVFRHDVAFEGLLGGFWAAQFGPEFRRALPPTLDALADMAEARKAQP